MRACHILSRVISSVAYAHVIGSLVSDILLVIREGPDNCVLLSSCFLVDCCKHFSSHSDQCIIVGILCPPPAMPPDTIPTFIMPSAPTIIPPVWEHDIAVLMKIPPSTAEGQNKRSWVLYHSLTSLEDFLMWELDTLQYDAITVCFPF